MATVDIGISGMALCVPRFRVNLNEWCQWVGDNEGKIRSVVGHSYRLPNASQDTYTMAAGAVMRLIQQYNLDPSRIGFLGFGTESSTDNSAGTVIIKGMIDRALRLFNLPSLSRQCEVPEFKHACLGGVYALKSALRYLALDGKDKLAVVVSGDIAKYAKGSSGEPTQGSGAVAMLLETKPKLLRLNLFDAGNSSRYRGLDFRKPFRRYLSQKASTSATQVNDFPLFNGQYSTSCYIDAVWAAIKDMLIRRRIKDMGSYFRTLRTLFMHRPYHRMPQSAWALSYLAALSHGGSKNKTELAGYCKLADVCLDSVIEELKTSPDLFEDIDENGYTDPYPNAMAVVRAFRSTDKHKQVVEVPMQLGSATMQDLGNLYTAALPAWLAAGLAQASEEKRDLAGEELLLVGYGSGDAAEAIPAQVVPQWRKAAQKIDIHGALKDPINLTQAQYEELHKTGKVEGLDGIVSGEFIIERTGVVGEGPLSDTGVDYYHYVQ